MNTLKSYGLRFLNRMGYEVIPKWRYREYEKAQLLRTVFEHHRIDTVLDVGGNTGQYRDVLREEAGFAGDIVTFEPVAELAATLTQRAAAQGDARWTVQNLALGQVEETRALNVTRDKAFTSFLKPVESPGLQAGEMGFDAQVGVIERQQVAVRRLDKVLPELLDDLTDRRVFLKVDTQGFDLEVLAGARGILDRVIGIQTEVSLIPIYEHMPNMDAALAVLKELGFHVSGLFPVARDKHLRVIEFDCVMLR